MKLQKVVCRISSLSSVQFGQFVINCGKCRCFNDGTVTPSPIAFACFLCHLQKNLRLFGCVHRFVRTAVWIWGYRHSQVLWWWLWAMSMRLMWYFYICICKCKMMDSMGTTVIYGRIFFKNFFFSKTRFREFSGSLITYMTLVFQDFQPYAP